MKIMKGENNGEAHRTILVYNNTTIQIIESVLEDVKQQLKPEPAPKIDETADVAELAQALLFVRYCFTQKTSR
jgi:hypothetical protein